MKLIGLTFFWIVLVCVLVSLVIGFGAYVKGENSKTLTSSPPPRSTTPQASPPPTASNLIIDYIPGYKYEKVTLNPNLLVEGLVDGGDLYGFDITLRKSANVTIMKPCSDLGSSRDACERTYGIGGSWPYTEVQYLCDVQEPHKVLLDRLVEIVSPANTSRLLTCDGAYLQSSDSAPDFWDQPLIVKTNLVDNGDALFYLFSVRFDLERSLKLRCIRVSDKEAFRLRTLDSGESIELHCLNWVSEIPMLSYGVEIFTDIDRISFIVSRAWSVKRFATSDATREFKMHVWATFQKNKPECVLSFLNERGEVYSDTEAAIAVKDFMSEMSCNLSNTNYSFMMYVPFVYYKDAVNKVAYVRRMLIQEAFDIDVETMEIRCRLSDDKVPFWGKWKVWISTVPKSMGDTRCLSGSLQQSLSADCVNSWTTTCENPTGL